MSSRIGTGPWARALGTALVPDDATPDAVRGQELWRRSAVEDLRIDVGQITAPFLPVLTPAGRDHPIFSNIGKFFPTQLAPPQA